MTAYRATRTEPRVNAGNGKSFDFQKGQIVELGPTGLNKDQAEYLCDQGLLIEVPNGSTDNPWFDSDDDELASQGDPKPKAESKTTK